MRILVALLLGMGACTGGNQPGWVELEPDDPGTGPVVRLAGTVRYLDLEGGLYVIQDARGVRYNPRNLPEEFRTDGLAVEADARHRDDMASIGMVGPIVELLRIRRLAAGDSAAGPPTIRSGSDGWSPSSGSNPAGFGDQS